MAHLAREHCPVLGWNLSNQGLHPLLSALYQSLHSLLVTPDLVERGHGCPVLRVFDLSSFASFLAILCCNIMFDLLELIHSKVKVSALFSYAPSSMSP